VKRTVFSEGCLLGVPPVIILSNQGAAGIVKFQDWISHRAGYPELGQGRSNGPESDSLLIVAADNETANQDVAEFTDTYSGRKIGNPRRIQSDLVGGKAHLSVAVVGGDGERVRRRIIKRRHGCGGGVTHVQRLRVRSTRYRVSDPISGDIITRAWVPSQRDGGGGFGPERSQKKREGEQEQKLGCSPVSIEIVISMGDPMLKAAIVPHFFETPRKAPSGSAKNLNSPVSQTLADFARRSFINSPIRRSRVVIPLSARPTFACKM